MPLQTILDTHDFEAWLNAYNSIVDAINEQFTITLDGGNDYTADSLAIKDAIRDKLATALRQELAGIYADSTDHEYVGQFWDEKATFDAGVSDNDLVYIHDSDGKYYLADASDENKSDVIGIADVTNGKVVCSGFVDIGGSIAANTKVYLSDTTPGEVTDTVSTVGVGVSLGSGLILLGTVGGGGGSTTSTEWGYFRYLATAGQTEFTGNDVNTNSLDYNVGKVQVFVNGILISPIDYTANDGSTITLLTAVDLNDIVEIYGYKDGATSGGMDVTQFHVDLTEDQTVITNTLFSENNTLLWYNGLKLVKGDDFNDTVGGQITLIGIDANVGDVLDVQIYNTTTTPITGAITSLTDVEGSYTGSAGQVVRVNADGDGVEFGNGWYTITNVNYSLHTNFHPKVFLDSTTQTFAVTLPSTPENGTEIDFIDIGGALETYNVTIGRNTRNIEGVADDLVLDINNIKIRLVFVNTTIGWKVLYL